MKQVFAVTLRHKDGRVEAVNVMLEGKVGDALSAVEKENPDSEALSANPICMVHQVVG